MIDYAELRRLAEAATTENEADKALIVALRNGVSALLAERDALVRVAEAAEAFAKSDDGRDLLAHEPDVGISASPEAVALADAVAMWRNIQEKSDAP